MKRFGNLLLGIAIGAGLTFSTGAFAATVEQVKAVFTDLQIVVNGKQAQLQARPLSYNGTTYLPVRDVANLTGYDVTYKADSATIELSNRSTSNSIPTVRKEAVKVQDTIYHAGDTVQFKDATAKIIDITYVDKFGSTLPGEGKKFAIVRIEGSVTTTSPYDNGDYSAFNYLGGFTYSNGASDKPERMAKKTADAVINKNDGLKIMSIATKIPADSEVVSIILRSPIDITETAVVNISAS